MIQAYDRALNLKQKIKHFGIDDNDREEVRQLMNQLMILAEVVGLHDRLSFDLTSRGWEVTIKSQISKVWGLGLIFNDFGKLFSDPSRGFPFWFCSVFCVSFDSFVAPKNGSWMDL